MKTTLKIFLFCIPFMASSQETKIPVQSEFDIVDIYKSENTTILYGHRFERMKLKLYKGETLEREYALEDPIKEVMLIDNDFYFTTDGKEFQVLNLNNFESSVIKPEEYKNRCSAYHKDQQETKNLRLYRTSADEKRYYVLANDSIVDSVKLRFSTQQITGGQYDGRTADLSTNLINNRPYTQSGWSYPRGQVYDRDSSGRVKIDREPVYQRSMERTRSSQYTRSDPQNTTIISDMKVKAFVLDSHYLILNKENDKLAVYSGEDLVALNELKLERPIYWKKGSDVIQQDPLNNTIWCFSYNSSGLQIHKLSDKRDGWVEQYKIGSKREIEMIKIVKDEILIYTNGRKKEVLIIPVSEDPAL